MAYRNHNPIEIPGFNGLYNQGNPEEVPLDHFTDAQNLRFVAAQAIASRYGVGVHQDVVAPLNSIKRIYNYITQEQNTLLVLTFDGTNGSIYHVVNSTTVFGPVLVVPDMMDFAFVPYAGRAYISPFKTYNVNGFPIEKGLEDEFLYVYKGDGTAARKAAGEGPPSTPAITPANGSSGATDAGLHLFGVVFETESGYLSPPGAFASFTTSSSSSVSFTTIPTSPDSAVIKRHIVATKVITGFNGNLTGYTYYFIPNAVINNNTSTALANISFYDADLLAEASYLLDNFAEIPAGAVLSLYHNRLCLGATFENISVAYVATAGEPEAINQIDGILTLPPDGNPITNIQELRDVLYVFKRNRTSAFADNDDVPSSWPLSIIDQALGCPVHGIATVTDSGATNVDFLIVATYQGISIFNGRFILPELSWKIRGIWTTLNREDFAKLQLINDPVQQQIYTPLPDGRMLVGNYANGLDPQKIRWMIWRFDMIINTIALVNTDELIFGSEGNML